MEIVRLTPGEPCPPADTGDCLFIRGKATISKLIMLVQPYSHVVSITGFPEAADAQHYGVVERSVSVYDDTERVLVKVSAHEMDRAQMAGFLQSVLAARWRYGYLTFVCVGLAMLTGWKLTFGVAATSTCSGLAAECLVRSGAIFPKPPAYVTPAILAAHFGV